MWNERFFSKKSFDIVITDHGAQQEQLTLFAITQKREKIWCNLPEQTCVKKTDFLLNSAKSDDHDVLLQSVTSSPQFHH